MRRLTTVSFGLIALALLAAMQAAPRLIALCQRECASADVCEMAPLPEPPPTEEKTGSGCCSGPERAAETRSNRPCERECAPADDFAQTPCASQTSPGQGERGKHCRRHPLPCDACIPSEFLVELPGKTSLKRPEVTVTGDYADAPQSGIRHLPHLIHTHSPPDCLYALSGAQRCLSIRVLLI